MLIRVGFDIAYSCPQPVATVLKLGIERGRARDLLKPDTVIADPGGRAAKPAPGHGHPRRPHTSASAMTASTFQVS